MLLSINLPVADSAGLRSDPPGMEPPKGAPGQSFAGVLDGLAETPEEASVVATGRGLPQRGKVLPPEPDGPDVAFAIAITVESLADTIAGGHDPETLLSTVSVDRAPELPAVGFADAAVTNQSLAEVATLSIRRLLGADALPGAPAEAVVPGAPAGVPPVEGGEPLPDSRHGLPDTIGKAIAAETGSTFVSAAPSSVPLTDVATVVAEAVGSKSGAPGAERPMAVGPAVAMPPQATEAARDTATLRASSPELIPPSLVPPSFVPGERAVEVRGSRTTEASTEAAVGRLFGGAQNASISSGPLLAHFGAAAAAAPSAPQATPVPGISVPPHDPGFGQMLGDRVLFMTGKSIPTAEIRMVPKDLGPVTVSIVVDDGRAELTFAAHHPHTRDAIELAMPRLREMLGDQGLTLGQASVTDSGAHRDRREDLPDNPKGVGLEGVGPAGPAMESSVDRLERAVRGLVDTFA
jgi:flagellar hook-length control protein FliK